MSLLNETHDVSLRSWVASAQRAGQDFTIQNLPFAVFRRKGSSEAYRGGIAIGDEILDLAAVAAAGVFEGDAAAGISAAAESTLNRFMGMGQSVWSAVRLAVSRALREGSPLEGTLKTALVAQSDAEYAVAARIGDYTDFYTSVHHATNVGKLFRPDNPLLPNYKWIPIGYHGRASSIDVSGQTFRRPVGQLMPPGAEQPIVASCKRLDYELEMGAFIGTGNALGDRIGIDAAESHIFGLCLLNDWSARDVQAWEYQPLGPFLAKNFATTISPWIVTLEALAPYRAAFERPASDPQPLAYLDSANVRSQGAFDIQLEVWLETPGMRDAGSGAVKLSGSNFRDAYWTWSQMVTHHAFGGCNLQPGDLLGSGTQSGPNKGEEGSLLELTVGGKQPIALANGEERTFLLDGDTIIFKGYCEKAGAARVGFGEVAGTVLPAQSV
ncbi:fumarylacetoacetase [Burkholderiaceae bacterium DAT-1]|nr:fumarylacetoacetase [Burkholderiaceae bacterium DAT-1]